jgi:hypothetical protein
MQEPPARETAQEKSGVIGGPSRHRAIDGEGGLPRTVSSFPSSTLPWDGVAPPSYSGAPPLASGRRRGRRGGAEESGEVGARSSLPALLLLPPPLPSRPLLSLCLTPIFFLLSLIGKGSGEARAASSSGHKTRPPSLKPDQPEPELVFPYRFCGYRNVKLKLSSVVPIKV